MRPLLLALLASACMAQGCYAQASRRVSIGTELTGHERQWTFVGSSNPWSQRNDGVLLSPTWALLGKRQNSAYIDDLTREDYAFPSRVPLADTDVSVDFNLRYAAVTDLGVAIRAQDSLRMYCVIVDDLDARRGSLFQVSLWLQDSGGIRRQIAWVNVPHAGIPEHIRQNGPQNYDEWLQSGAGWTTLRVQAVGSRITVSLNDKKVLQASDGTYKAGAAGLIARWAIMFRNFTISGTPSGGKETWPRISGPRPKFSEPFAGKFGNYELFPAVTQDRKGNLYVIANVSSAGSFWTNPFGIAIVQSADGGKTWVDPRRFDNLGAFAPHSHAGLSPSLYVRKNGHMSCFLRFRPSVAPGATPEQLEMAPETIGVADSADGGHTWSAVRSLVPLRKPLDPTPGETFYLYSPVQRLRDGTLLLSAYNALSATQSRTAFFRSLDDGASWTGPILVDREKFDTNEGMVAELADGRLEAFMRTVRNPLMWTSYSTDRGTTWSPLKESNVTGDCPFLLNLRSGTIVMGSRGYGIMLKFSQDGGKTWSPLYRVASASGMMGMTELNDGTVMVVYHTGYRAPARIRTQLLRIARGTIEALD